MNSGHIACDLESNSEIVIPLMKNERFIGVLDLDSPQLARFDERTPPGWKHSCRFCFRPPKPMSVKTPIIVARQCLSSNTGKTTLVCELLQRLPGWEAIKLTRGHYRSCGKDPNGCCVSDLLARRSVDSFRP